MGKRWILGAIAKIVTRLHYRYEVKPYAEKMGHSRGAVRAASAIAVARVFDEAWPAADQREGGRE